jgi:7-keto-8-aminopelargonate synthetase-like enzyme
MLFDDGVYVNPVVSPATPVGQALLRTSYTATHTTNQMDRAIEKIVKTLKTLDIVK